jgi:hypothetical protein
MILARGQEELLFIQRTKQGIVVKKHHYKLARNETVQPVKKTIGLIHGVVPN